MARQQPPSPAAIAQARASLGLAPDALLLLRAGVLYAFVDDQEPMLEGYAAFLHTHPDARLVMCGHNYQEGRIAAALERFGIAKKVRWLGFLDAPDYAALLHAADVTLCPGLSRRVQPLPPRRQDRRVHDRRPADDLLRQRHRRGPRRRPRRAAPRSRTRPRRSARSWSEPPIPSCAAASARGRSAGPRVVRRRAARGTTGGVLPFLRGRRGGTRRPPMRAD